MVRHVPERERVTSEWVIAPVAGLLASLRRQPLLREGDLVARILTPARTIRCERARPRGERHERRFGFRP